jgi:hypothetical protein
MLNEVKIIELDLSIRNKASERQAKASWVTIAGRQRALELRLVNGFATANSRCLQAACANERSRATQPLWSRGLYSCESMSDP